MTKHPRPSSAAPAWLAATSALVWIGVKVRTPWLQVVLLIGTAAALRLSLQALSRCSAFRHPLARRSRTTNVICPRGDTGDRHADSIRRKAAEALDASPRCLEISLAGVVAFNPASRNALLTAVQAARERGVAGEILHTGHVARAQLHRSGLGPLVDHAGSHELLEEGR